MEPWTLFYTKSGITTNLDDFADSTCALPSEPNALAEVVRGLLIHEGIVAQRKMRFASDRMADRDTVGAGNVLRRVLEIDPAPLTVERDEQNRMVSFCYQFALLLCAFLRAKDVPARARCGFASYFRQGFWIDHWVVEYWSGSEWVVIDPDAGRDDVPRSEFNNAGEAWILCREGKLDPAIHGNYFLWGWDELRGSLVNDIGSLNKVECGSWNWCTFIDISDREMPDEVIDAKLDSLAPLVLGSGSLEEVMQTYRLYDWLHPPT